MKLLQKYPWIIPDDGEEWVPVEATPIAEHVYALFTEGHFDMTHLPMRSPWHRFFVEFTDPYGVRVRTLLRAELHTDRDRIGGLVQHICEMNGRDVPKDIDVHEVIYTNVFSSVARGRPVARGDIILGLGRDGDTQLFYADKEQGLPAILDGGVDPASLAGILVMLQAILAFLNCKNVTVEDEPSPYRKAKRRRQKRGGIVYKQLVVDGKPITRQPGRESREDAERRYHICRGHFADHREHGLFGKPSLRGIYWVPMHARGSKHHGEVIKDYLVAP